MPSAKTAVIEHLFFVTKGYTEAGGIADPVVTSDEVIAALHATNPALEASGKKPLSTKNPANFWKDLTRNNLAANWPPRVLEAGFTGDDAIGLAEGAVFTFIEVLEGEAPFGQETEPSDDALATPIVLESLSMPLTMKALGRGDENWLAQVAARLRILETHFAVTSDFDATEMTFLQTGIKMGNSEVDAAYSLTDGAGDLWLLAVEAKGRRDKIHVPQVLRSAASLYAQAQARGQNAQGVIPMALKVIGRSRVHVVEFAPDQGAGSDGTIVTDSVIELHPHVPGIE